MKRRDMAITAFVLAWSSLFFYQTFRVNYLNPWCKQHLGIELPTIPLLFPPAGWIMFYNVDASYGFAEVYGLRDGFPLLIDPHEIFPMKNLGYDNIRRNVLVTVLDRYDAPAFCRYLRGKFPAYEGFAVVYATYPDLVHTPERILRQVAYRCP